MKYLRTKENELIVDNVYFSQIFTQQEDEQIYEEIKDVGKLINLLNDY